MKNFSRIIVLFVSFILAGPLYAAGQFNAEQFKKDIEETRDIYLKAVDGKKRDVRKAIRHIQKLDRKYPRHPLVLVYKGGSLSLRGSNIGERPLNRMRETEEGLGYIDRALRMLPRHKGDYLEVVEAQLVAAYVFINLPDTIFHRLKEGSHLVKKLLKHRRFDELPEGLQAAIYFAAATMAEKHSNEIQQKRYLQLTIETDPKGRNREKAEALLKQL